MKAAVAKMAGELSWRSVVGPAAAVALIAEELDWKWVSATTWTTSEGLVLDAAVVCPRDIKEMAKREFVEVYSQNMFSEWADLTKIVKPVGSPFSRCRSVLYVMHRSMQLRFVFDVRLVVLSCRRIKECYF